MADRPSAEQLWRQAGGGTPSYSRERYHELMLEHGLLVRRQSDDPPNLLPCWRPNRRVTTEVHRGRRNVHCSNCGDERGGPFGHETSECTYVAAP